MINFETSSTDTLSLFKNALSAYGYSGLSNYLSVNKGTLKRWILLDSVPEDYRLELCRLLGIEVDYSELSYKEKDQFFTNHETVERCLNIFNRKMKEVGVDVNDYTFIEPSAGDGAFFNKLPDNKIGLDIEPRCEGVVKADYLTYTPNEGKYIVIGNPPFGLRGNMALKFINRSAKFADFVAFVLPPLFNSTGKGAPMLRVKGYKLLHTEEISPKFYYPDGEEVIVNSIFQIWSKDYGDFIEKTCIDQVKVYSLSDGGDAGSTRNKQMLDKCDFYLPSTVFGESNVKLYDSFEDLPQRRGYGIVVLKDVSKVKKVISSTDWASVCFKSTNGACNLRTDIINKTIKNSL